MIVTLDAKRRLSISAALAPASPGDQFDATFDSEEDVVILRRVKRKANWLEVWKKCPVPMDDLPPRGRELPKKDKRDFERPGLKVFNPFKDLPKG